MYSTQWLVNTPCTCPSAQCYWPLSNRHVIATRRRAEQRCDNTNDTTLTVRFTRGSHHRDGPPGRCIHSQLRKPPRPPNWRAARTAREQKRTSLSWHARNMSHDVIAKMHYAHGAACHPICGDCALTLPTLPPVLDFSTPWTVLTPLFYHRKAADRCRTAWIICDGAFFRLVARKKKMTEHSGLGVVLRTPVCGCGCSS